MGHRNYIIEQKTKHALEEKEKAFAAKHLGDTNAQLLDYVKQCAKRIGHSPNACEVIGGRFIAKRFGTWEAVLEKLGLPKPGPVPFMESRLIYKQEVTQQVKLMKARQEQKRALKEQRRRELEEQAAAQTTETNA